MSKKLKFWTINFLKKLLELLGVGVQEREGVFIVIRHPLDEDQILLVRHGYGTKKWSLPGGGIKQGEFAPDAGRRETNGETDLNAYEVELIGHFSFRIKYGFVLLFRCVHFAGMPREKGDGKEIIECKYFHKDNLPEMYDAGRGMIGWAEWARQNNYAQIYYGHPDKPPLKKHSK